MRTHADSTDDDHGKRSSVHRKVVNEKEAMDERLIAEELPARQLDGKPDRAAHHIPGPPSARSMRP
jgi:hypothetical protein